MSGTVQIPATGREWVTWTLADAPAGMIQVSIDGGVTWHDCERPTVTTARVLVAGPDADSNPTGALVLTEARSVLAYLKVVTDSEVIIRAAGYLVAEAMKSGQ